VSLTRTSSCENCRAESIVGLLARQELFHINNNLIHKRNLAWIHSGDQEPGVEIACYSHSPTGSSLVGPGISGGVFTQEFFYTMHVKKLWTDRYHSVIMIGCS
jgi:hypothetical protein